MWKQGHSLVSDPYFLHLLQLLRSFTIPLNRVEYNDGMNALSDNSIVSAAFFAGMEVYLVSAIT